MNVERPVHGLSAAKIALAVKRLRAETEGIHLLAAEPLAIVGIGCRFPGGGNSPEEFWQMLEQGVDAVREIPEQRWPVAGLAVGNVRRGAYFDQVDTFDAEFFNIPPREANCIDPQQRMLLEVTWDALNDAGIRPDSLAGTQTGVFVAISNTDYTRLQLRDVAQSNSHTGLGSAACLAAGHLSFLLDTRGPSLVVDTACSSSLTAAHLASQSLRSRECDLALVGAASLKILPDEVVVFSQWGMLSIDSHCKTFDEHADGFVPGEGCGVIVLKRLADALASGDRIRAVIRGSAVNHDGRTSVMTAPNGLAQEAVLRAALKNASVEATDVTFVETHGTGTSLGDPIEVEALRSVYGNQVAAACRLGAVKTNLGHLESAAGMAGLIKVIVALEHEKIPRNLHFQNLNPRISLDGSRLELVQQTTAWPREKRPRLAGVSSFGLSGTNAHFILEEAPARPEKLAPQKLGEYLLVLSARSEQALEQLALRYCDLLAESRYSLQDICANAAIYCQHYEYRLAVTGECVEAIRSRLLEFREETPDSRIFQGVARRRQQGTAFVFSGQGSAWMGMGRELLAQYPRTRTTVDRIDGFFSKLAGWSLADALTGKDESRSIAETETAQPLIFAIQIAIAELLASWGIAPDAVAGHSIGELAAAYVGGYLSLDEAVRILHLRSDCMGRTGKYGRMLAIALTAKETQSLLETYGSRVVIAAYNSPRSLTLAGEEGALIEIASLLESRKISARWVAVEYAFHSPAMKNAAEEFASRLGNVTYLAGSIPLISTVTGKTFESKSEPSTYWADGIMRPVRFQQAIDSLLESGVKTFVEIGPGTALSHFVADCAVARQITVSALPSMRKSVPIRRSLNSLLATLYTQGKSIEWGEIFGARPAHVPLPSYPWQRKRYWLDQSVVAQSAHTDTLAQSASSGHPLLGERIQSPFSESALFQSQWSAATLPYLQDHRLDETPLVPFSAWIELAATAQLASHSVGQAGEHFALLDLALTQPLLLPPQGSRVQVAVDEHSFRAASLSGEVWTSHATARYAASDRGPECIDLASLRARCSEAISPDEVYQTLAAVGLEYGPAFRTIQQIWASDKEALAFLRLPDLCHAGADIYGMHPVLLDGCLQILGAAIGNKAKDLFLPISLDRYENFGRAEELWVHARVIALSGEQLTADFVIADSSGIVVARIDGLRARRSAARIKDSGLQYELVWRPGPFPIAGQQVAGQRWLVVQGNEAGRGDLQRSLEARGCRGVFVGDREQLHLALLSASWTGLILDARSVLPLPYSIEDRTEFHPEQWAVRALLDALKTVAGHGPIKIRIITSHAMPVRASEETAISQATLWGLARTLQLEHPEHATLIFDVDEIELDSAQRTSFIEELLSHRTSGEYSEWRDACVAYRQGQRYIPRLERSSVMSPDSQMSRADTSLQSSVTVHEMAMMSAAGFRQSVASGTVLISGGLGALGLMTARWLADNGARNLVLVSRSAGMHGQLNGDVSVSTSLAELRAGGVQVVVAAVDVSEENQLQGLLETVRATMPPLGAVFHEAGVANDAMLRHLDWETYYRVTSPKIAGAWNLHRLTQQDPVKFMVLFSSAASVLGSTGQAGYAAANGFLDALAHYRSARGLRTISINWGAWADAGMAAKLSRQHAERLAHQGLHPMFAETALPALLSAIAFGKSQVAIMDVDWELFSQTASESHQVLCKELTTETRQRPQHKAQRGVLLEALRDAPVSRHRSVISAYIKQFIRQVLALDDSFVIEDDRPLQELGLDSLMAIEIKNLLQSATLQELRPTIIFDHPTVEALVEYLDMLLWAARQQQDAQPGSAQQEEIRI